jgi:hypothetical protein
MGLLAGKQKIKIKVFFKIPHNEGMWGCGGKAPCIFTFKRTQALGHKYIMASFPMGKPAPMWFKNTTQHIG